VSLPSLTNIGEGRVDTMQGPLISPARRPGRGPTPCQCHRAQRFVEMVSKCTAIAKELFQVEAWRGDSQKMHICEVVLK
jgi:hypothetical protein